MAQNRSAEEVEAILSRLAKLGQLENDIPYARADLIQLFIGQGDPDPSALFNSFRDYAEMPDALAPISVTTTGAKKGRRYTFKDLPSLEGSLPASEPGTSSTGADCPPMHFTTEGIPSIKAQGATKAGLAPKGGGVAGTVPRTNDHPEDREHISAHIALMLVSGCIAYSLPKKTGGGRDENPDIVGVISHPYQQFPNLLDWMKRGAPSSTSIVGIEVKALVNSPSQLFTAVREARHNSRYFDQAWLAAPIAQELRMDAKELGEEYDVGVLTWPKDQPADAEVLWATSSREGTKRIDDFFLRMSPEMQKHLLEVFRRLKAEAEKLRQEKVHVHVVRSLLSTQRLDSLVQRLPRSVIDSLTDRRSEPNETSASDMEAFASAVLTLSTKAYDLYSDEDSTLAKYLVEKCGIKEFLQRESHHEIIAPPAVAAVRTRLLVLIEDTLNDWNSVKSIVEA